MKMNWNELLSDRRWGRESEGNDPPARASGTGRRSHFEQDYDRLVFSPAFRRLQNKAQIFPLPGNVFVHNRLTHSLEVSCVGRSLGSKVSDILEERYGVLPFSSYDISSIVAAACLAHDMGNPPFGHSGERAISSYFSQGEGLKWREKVLSEGGRWEDFTHFEGNANTFRLLTHRFVGRRPGGFSLTYSTLAAIVKYPYPSTEAISEDKFGFFEPEEEAFGCIAKQLGLISSGSGSASYCRHPLVYLVEAADDICYEVMDLEDAFKLRILSIDEVTELMLAFFESEEQEHMREVVSTIDDPNENVAYLRSKTINKLIAEAADTFAQHEEEILQGRFKGSLLHASSERCQIAYQAAIDVAYSRIYSSHDVVDVELAGHRIFAELIDRMMHALEYPQHAYSKTFLKRVSSQYDTAIGSTYGRILTTLDYISGMTDLFALDLYRKITGMNLPHV